MMCKLMHHSIKYIKCIFSLSEVTASVTKIAVGFVCNCERDLLLRLELCGPIRWKNNAIIFFKNSHKRSHPKDEAI